MLDWDAIAPMVVAIVLFITVGGVLVLRPIAKHLGTLLEAMTREKLQGSDRQEMMHVRELLETMNQRLQLMEERQEFTDRLLEERGTPRLSGRSPTSET